ncbi:FAD:protein FMN transferase [Parvularcula oceani]|uniref:FAD:protein FMN transferase n=1 Tax=Parvularcula oceani TaxID=1247963 RepID=UPI00068C9F72|nr:FAD:protein FMN transferase [Parvularcula oceani]
MTTGAAGGADRLVLVPSGPPPAAPPRDAPVIRAGGRTMGTRWSVAACGPAIDERAIGRAAEGVFSKICRAMSHWDEGSEICRFNAASAGTRHRLSEDFFAVLTAAADLAEASGGAFDPGLLGASAAAGAAPPGTGSARAEEEQGRWRQLALDPEGRSAMQPGGLRLDLSGIAKGHAVDRLCEAVLAAGADTVLAEIGGEFAGYGLKPDLSPWWVAAEAGGAAGAVAALHKGALATSGGVRRNAAGTQRRISHVVPASGAEGNDLIVTVLHETCSAADGWASGARRRWRWGAGSRRAVRHRGAYPAWRRGAPAPHSGGTGVHRRLRTGKAPPRAAPQSPQCSSLPLPGPR